LLGFITQVRPHRLQCVLAFSLALELVEIFNHR
jgi:hypothetical protein